MIFSVCHLPEPDYGPLNMVRCCDGARGFRVEVSSTGERKGKENGNGRKGNGNIVFSVHCLIMWSSSIMRIQGDEKKLLTKNIE